MKVAGEEEWKESIQRVRDHPVALGRGCAGRSEQPGWDEWPILAIRSWEIVAPWPGREGVAGVPKVVEVGRLRPAPAAVEGLAATTNLGGSCCGATQLPSSLRIPARPFARTSESRRGVASVVGEAASDGNATLRRPAAVFGVPTNKRPRFGQLDWTAARTWTKPSV